MVFMGFVRLCLDYPPLLRRMRLRSLMLLSGFSILLYQVLPLSSISFYSNELQMNRIVSFYPMFLFGYWLKCHYADIEKNLPTQKARMLLLITLLLYVACCVKSEGLAWKSGLYIAFDSSLKDLTHMYLSYFFMLLISFLVIFSTPDRHYRFTCYGERTMNVYLLHMVIVFPLSYGLFAKITDDAFWVICNSSLCVGACLFFFSDAVDKWIKKVLYNKRWLFVMIFWLLSLALVNIN